MREGGGGYVDMIRYWAGYSTRGVVTMNGLVNAVNTTRDLKGAAGGQTVTLWSRKFRPDLVPSRANVCDVGPALIQRRASASCSDHSVRWYIGMYLENREGVSAAPERSSPEKDEL